MRLNHVLRTLFKADVWALGITFFCMATGYYPFNGKTKSDIKKSISIGEINFTKYDIDKRIRFLIVKMTQIAPNLRQSPDKLRSLLMFNQPVVAYKKKSFVDRCKKSYDHTKIDVNKR